MNTENKQQQIVKTIPPSGKRTKPIIIEAVFMNLPQAEKEKVDSIVLVHLLQAGLFHKADDVRTK
jgi:hypothetical protein